MCAPLSVCYVTCSATCKAASLLHFWILGPGDSASGKYLITTTACNQCYKRIYKSVKTSIFFRSIIAHRAVQFNTLIPVFTFEYKFLAEKHENFELDTTCGHKWFYKLPCFHRLVNTGLQNVYSIGYWCLKGRGDGKTHTHKNYSSD